MIEVESSFSQIASSVFDGENYQFWGMKILGYNYTHTHTHTHTHTCFAFNSFYWFIHWRQSQEYYMFFSLRNIYQQQS